MQCLVKSQESETMFCKMSQKANSRAYSIYWCRPTTPCPLPSNYCLPLPASYFLPPSSCLMPAASTYFLPHCVHSLPPSSFLLQFPSCLLPPVLFLPPPALPGALNPGAGEAGCQAWRSREGQGGQGRTVDKIWIEIKEFEKNTYWR